MQQYYFLLLLFIFLPFIGFSQEISEGKASFYSDWFIGRTTANGEKFSQEKYTAAHKTLPFGTWVEVFNIQNKRSVIVRINDRGPYVKGRIIDLSKTTAKEIGNLAQGIFDVRITIHLKDTNLIYLQKKSATLKQRSPHLDFSLINL